MAARSSVVSRGSMDFGDNIKRLLKMRLLVGIPGDSPARDPEPGEKGTPPNNAVLGLINELGDDERNIPARPFLIPGVLSIQDKIVDQFRKAGEDALDRDFGQVEARFVKAGTIAADAVKAKLTDGPFAPLSQRTIEARARRGRKGAKQYVKLQSQGVPRAALDDLGDQALVRPLIDSGQLRRAVTYVVKDRTDP